MVVCVFALRLFCPFKRDVLVEQLRNIETRDTADVKYHSEYLAQSAGLPRAYVVLYNYCKKKSFIEAWCTENVALVKDFVDINELVEGYMLGYIKQKRYRNEFLCRQFNR